MMELSDELLRQANDTMGTALANRWQRPSAPASGAPTSTRRIHFLNWPAGAAIVLAGLGLSLAQGGLLGVAPRPAGRRRPKLAAGAIY